MTVLNDSNRVNDARHLDFATRSNRKLPSTRDRSPLLPSSSALHQLRYGNLKFIGPQRDINPTDRDHLHNRVGNGTEEKGGEGEELDVLSMLIKPRWASITPQRFLTISIAETMETVGGLQNLCGLRVSLISLPTYVRFICSQSDRQPCIRLLLRSAKFRTLYLVFGSFMT